MVLGGERERLFAVGRLQELELDALPAKRVRDLDGLTSWCNIH
jgi:hypothetical protein